MGQLRILTAEDVELVLYGRDKDIIEVVKAAYLSHSQSKSTLPHSSFLRFPHRAKERIIALPAYLESAGGEAVAGIKWISSFPGNIDKNMPRASAVMLLNDINTGQTICCLEASSISAKRTAASAVVAIETLLGKNAHVRSIAFIGCGFIARSVFSMLSIVGLRAERAVFFDIDTIRAEEMAASVRHLDGVGKFEITEDVLYSLSGDVVVFATTASHPYLPSDYRFGKGQIVLHLSLRDIHPDTILESQNITDDIEHSLRAETSLHLASKISNVASFYVIEIASLLLGSQSVDPDLPTIFSPFGLGVLDLAVSGFVLSEAKLRELGHIIENFSQY